MSEECGLWKTRIETPRSVIRRCVSVGKLQLRVVVHKFLCNPWEVVVIWIYGDEIGIKIRGKLILSNNMDKCSVLLFLQDNWITNCNNNIRGYLSQQLVPLKDGV